MALVGIFTGLVSKKGPAWRVLEQHQSRELTLREPEQQPPEEPQQQYRVSLCPRHLPEAGMLASRQGGRERALRASRSVPGWP